MKKFGTPTGAGPGIDSEKVGLLAAGTPLPVGRLDFALRFGLDLDLDLDFGFDFGLWVFVPDFFSVLELGAC
jgi:hypothetical protein